MVDTSHMHHIPFSVAQVLATLLGTLNAGERPPRDQIQMWKEFGLKVDLVFTARYHLLKKSLIEDFEPFDPNLGAPTDLPAPKVNLLEDRFFSNMREMLAKANFRMLGREEAETATSHDFLNTVPIEPEWLKLDPVFQRYMEAHPDLAAQVPNFASRLWIFHRGVGLAKFNGIVPMQAVDLLLLSLLGKCCGKASKHKEPPAEAAAAIAEDDKGKQEGPKLVRGSADLPKDSVLVESKGVKRIGMRNQGATLVHFSLPLSTPSPPSFGPRARWHHAACGGAGAHLQRGCPHLPRRQWTRLVPLIRESCKDVLAFSFFFSHHLISFFEVLHLRQDLP